MKPRNSSDEENRIDAAVPYYSNRQREILGYPKDIQRSHPPHTPPSKVRHHGLSEDKENFCEPLPEVNPFERSKKNPIRLSNRFKKVLKKEKVQITPDP